MTGLSYVEISRVDRKVVAGGIVDIQPIEVPQIVGAGSIVFRDIFRSFFWGKVQSFGDALNPQVQWSY